MNAHGRYGNLARAGAVAIVSIALLTVGGCASSPDKAELTPGTRPAGLPPVAPDLYGDVYCQDGVFNGECADAPSGLENCKDLVRRAAERELAALLRQETDVTETEQSTSRVFGDTGERVIAEDRTFMRDVSRTVVSDLRARRHPSPLLAIGDGDNYTMRVCLVREEVDFEILSKLADEARDEDRDNVANRMERLLEDRYPEGVPDQEKIEQVGKRIAEHYQDMWNSSWNQAYGEDD